LDRSVPPRPKARLERFPPCAPPELILEYKQLHRDAPERMFRRYERLLTDPEMKSVWRRMTRHAERLEKGPQALSEFLHRIISNCDAPGPDSHDPRLKKACAKSSDIRFLVCQAGWLSGRGIRPAIARDRRDRHKYGLAPGSPSKCRASSADCRFRINRPAMKEGLQKENRAATRTDRQQVRRKAIPLRPHSSE